MIRKMSGSQGKNVTCTLLRKGLVTLVHQENNSHKESMVASFMKNDVRSTKTYYNLLDSNRHNVEAFEFIRSLHARKGKASENLPSTSNDGE